MLYLGFVTFSLFIGVPIVDTSLSAVTGNVVFVCTCSVVIYAFIFFLGVIVIVVRHDVTFESNLPSVLVITRRVDDYASGSSSRRFLLSEASFLSC